VGIPNVPNTQAAIALAFLKERGCLDVRRRRSCPACGFLLDHRTIELHTLDA